MASLLGLSVLFLGKFNAKLKLLGVALLSNVLSSSTLSTFWLVLVASLKLAGLGALYVLVSLT